MNSADPYAAWDAAYVLGALPVQQRHAYEEHLAECADCRAAVGDLAGMPGLLAQLPAAEANALGGDGTSGPGSGVAVPASLMGMSLPRVRSRWWITAAVIIALLVGGAAGYGLRSATEPARTPPASISQAADRRVAFTAVNGVPLIAVADLVPGSGATTVKLECQYSGSSGYGGIPRYALWAVDSSGRRLRGDTWRALPGALISSSSRFAVPRSRIVQLAIVDVDSGDVLMRAQV